MGLGNVPLAIRRYIVLRERPVRAFTIGSLNIASDIVTTPYRAWARHERGKNVWCSVSHGTHIIDRYFDDFADFLVFD